MALDKDFAPIVVLGASLASFGIAAKNPEEVLVIEPSSLVGQEFIDSFHLGEGWEKDVHSPFAQHLRSELEERNILSADGLISIPPLAPVLFNRIRTMGLSFLFQTSITAVEKGDDGYLVTLWNNSGFRTLKTDCVIDTSATALSTFGKAAEGRILRKSLNGMIYPKCPDAPIPQDIPGIARFWRGRFSKEVVVSFELELSDNWITARQKIHDFWQSRQIPDWELAILASTFDYEVDPGPYEIAENWYWLPSCAYANALQAVDGGTEFISAKEVQR